MNALVIEAEGDAGDADIDPSISCADCEACCCKLEVILMGDDDVPAALTVEDPWGGSVMRRLADEWCVAVDRNTMMCRIYERRPGVCRDYQAGASECRVERGRRLVSRPVAA